MTQKEWNYTVYVVVRYWMGGDSRMGLNQQQFRQKHKAGYTWYLLYDVQPDSGTDFSFHGFKLTRRPLNKQPELLVLSNHMVFSGIRECHNYKKGHMRGAASNHVEAKLKFYNISLAQVKAYIETCPICLGSSVRGKRHKGAKKPILSGSFRGRFQVDLIDFTPKARENVYGVCMKFLFVLKDRPDAQGRYSREGGETCGT
jgi:hypothetical protein